MKCAISHLKNSTSAILQVSGWVRSVRIHKNVSFISLSDGTTVEPIQIVTSPDVAKGLVTQGLAIGASISCIGTKSISKNGKLDLTAQQVSLIGPSIDFPIQKKETSNEHLRELIQFRPRTEHFSSVLRVRSFIATLLRTIMENENFQWISTPILTRNDCEGAGELFTVNTTKKQEKFFNSNEVYLTVSGQLHSEIFVHGLSKVYTFGPTFRAENSNTSRHLAEFWMFEPEMAFHTVDEAASLAENCIKFVSSNLLEKKLDELEYLQQSSSSSSRGSDKEGLIGRVTRCSQQNFIRMSYSEACNILAKKCSEPVETRGPLTSIHERFLVEQYSQGVPIIVFNYPKEIKPFYALANDDENNTSACFDLLVPGIGELVGGSAREHRFEILEEKMNESKLLPDLQWYLDLRRYGTTPHAGFGIGFDRLVQFMTGSDNIRDVSPIPRYPGSISF